MRLGPLGPNEEPTSLELAERAKTAFRAHLFQERGSRPEWLRGIGISWDGDDAIIKVNVSELSSDVWNYVPAEYDGVRIMVEAVGDITAGGGK